MFVLNHRVQRAYNSQILCDNVVSLYRRIVVSIFRKCGGHGKFTEPLFANFRPFRNTSSSIITEREREFTQIVLPIIPPYDLFTTQGLACYHNQRPITAVPKKTKKSISPIAKLRSQSLSVSFSLLV